MALQPSSSSSSSITYAFTYDVFLSFRGSDTRHGFTGNLYKALCDKGIHTFIDHEELKRGVEITPALTKAIEESRIAIPIFSVNYASSSFCLDELVTIMECVKEKGRLVFPVFYDVDPSHVRHQIGTYAEALAKHEKRFQDNMEKLKDNMERLQKWKMTLNQSANLSGSHFKPGDGYEHKFIEKIVKEVSRKISRVALPITDYPVGLESQVQSVISLLDVGSDDRVHMVGIHGTGGIGKTTLALAVYNLIADHFEGLCFLENVRENSNKYGLLHLQKTLLFAVLGEKKIEITSAKQGISTIQHRLKQKKILLILDDVDQEDQLKHVVGRPSWFGHGSRVIITTRDKHLLACHGVERTHEAEELNQNDAFELLRWKAFKHDKVRPSYVDMLNRAVAYASGLPLALEVIGSNLYRKSVQEWESAIEQYERIPDKKIQKILKMSFDALEEEAQSVFLDIACCFLGYRFEEVKNILDAHHDQSVEYQIGVLIDKSLIKITHGRVKLHDLIEDMGKEIVRQESPKEPRKRSRLWSHKDIFEVLEENKGTSKIEMIHLNSWLFEEVDVDWDEEAFKKMKKLKTLIIRNSHFSKGPKFLPNSLRVLVWWNYPLQDLPHDFHPKKLSICKLPLNRLMSLELLISSKKFMTMKVLNLDICRDLTEICDLSSLPNLEELSFRYCSNLITIDHSVGFLDKLKILDATACYKLRSFPTLKLPSLEVLTLRGCLSLESFPEILEEMRNVNELVLDRTNITKFSSSFQNLTRLQKLAVPHFLPPSSLVMMPQLSELSILESTGRIWGKEEESEEKVSSMLLSSKIECLTLFLFDLSHGSIGLFPLLFPNLKELTLTSNKFTILPECIKQCSFLCKLFLLGCNQLREIEGIPPSLKYLSARGCESLSFSCRSMLLKQELHEAGNTDFYLPSLETGRVPEWFEHQSSRGPSPSLSFWFRNNFPNNLLLCLISPLPAKMDDYHKVEFTFNGYEFPYFSASRGYTRLVSVTIDTIKKNFNLNVDEALLENEWIHAEVMFDSEEQISLNLGIGIHVLKECSSMEDIRFTSPYKL